MFLAHVQPPQVYFRASLTVSNGFIGLAGIEKRLHNAKLPASTRLFVATMLCGVSSKSLFVGRCSHPRFEGADSPFLLVPRGGQTCVVSVIPGQVQSESALGVAE